MLELIRFNTAVQYSKELLGGQMGAEHIESREKKPLFKAMKRFFPDITPTSLGLILAVDFGVKGKRIYNALPPPDPDGPIMRDPLPQITQYIDAYAGRHAIPMKFMQVADEMVFQEKTIEELLVERGSS